LQAPENFTGGAVDEMKCDVFSFGVLLWCVPAPAQFMRDCAED
jgi:hypothetical protein